MSSTRSHLWGYFDLGVIEGWLRSSRVLVAHNGAVEFKWRGRDTREGRSTFEEENVAKFTFVGDGTFSGTMYWGSVGTFQIVGVKAIERSKDRVWSKDILTWKSEFYELNQENTDFEYASRWGGCYSRGSPKRERHSDTEDDLGNDAEDDYQEDVEDDYKEDCEDNYKVVAEDDCKEIVHNECGDRFAYSFY